MKHKLETSHSSWLVSLPLIILCLLSGALSAFFGLGQLSAALIFFGVMALCARLWAFAGANKVSIRITSKVRGLFPGEDVSFDVHVRNDKFLPVVWLDLFCPLSRSLCLVPEETRVPDEWEMAVLADEQASIELVGEQHLPSLLWYENTCFTVRWQARQRGVYSTAGWRLRTGDGFGLAQVESPIPREDVREFAVYPRLIPVSPSLFLRSLWNADTGSKGVMADPTVIRSTRDYIPSDSFKQINWRLAARGLPLSVNVYEDILPKGVHFIFDGESFSGPPSHLEEMEDALSILASELVRLHQAQVGCGLSLCQGRTTLPHNRFNAEDPHPLLRMLAAYEPLEPKWDADAATFVPQLPVFQENELCSAKGVGRFYYITYNTDTLPSRTLLRRLDRTQLSILTYEDCVPFGEFETVCLRRLKEG